MAPCHHCLESGVEAQHVDGVIDGGILPRIHH